MFAGFGTNMHTGNITLAQRRRQRQQRKQVFASPAGRRGWGTGQERQTSIRQGHAMGTKGSKLGPEKHCHANGKTQRHDLQLNQAVPERLRMCRLPATACFWDGRKSEPELGHCCPQERGAAKALGWSKWDVDVAERGSKHWHMLVPHMSVGWSQWSSSVWHHNPKKQYLF